MLRILAMLAVIAALSAAGLAEAHVGLVDRAVFEAPRLPAPVESIGHALVAEHRADPSWAIAFAMLLLAVSLVRRRSRRLVIAALALLVAVLGVEAAVHSVHHGGGSDPVACPTASVAAHMDGAAVAVLSVAPPIQEIAAAAASFDPLPTTLRSLDPSQPRAPPAPLV